MILRKENHFPYYSMGKGKLLSLLPCVFTSLRCSMKKGLRALSLDEMFFWMHPWDNALIFWTDLIMDYIFSSKTFIHKYHVLCIPKKHLTITLIRKLLELDLGINNHVWILSTLRDLSELTKFANHIQELGYTFKGKTISLHSNIFGLLAI